MAKKPVKKRRPAPVQDQLIVDTLRDVGRPISAYELIDQLRDKGVSAPPTVYRALNRLIADGLAHRVESLNAFVACKHPHHDGAALFAICESCGVASEFEQDEVVALLRKWAGTTNFSLREITLELRGRCAECVAAGRTPETSEN
jgi:Fur family zinc uptake transcriptional regulator